MHGREMVTLDFEGNEVRMLIAKRGEVLRWDSVSMPSDHLDQGLVVDPIQVGATIRDLLAKHKAPRRRVVTSVTGQRSISRIFALPSVKAALLEPAVMHKSRQEIPLPPEDTYLSWQVVSSTDQHVQVYVLAVPRELIDRQMEALRAARVKPRAIDARPLALVRAVNQSDAIIVNLENQSLAVILVVGNVPVINRSIPFGSEESGPREKLDRLYKELARTTKFYDERHRDQALLPGSPLFITGALFESEEFRDEISRRVPYAVMTPDPPLSYPEGFPLAPYSVNLGLALKRV